MMRDDNEPKVSDGLAGIRRKSQGRESTTLLDELVGEIDGAYDAGLRAGEQRARSSSPDSSSWSPGPAARNAAGNVRASATAFGSIFAPLLAELGVITTRGIVRDHRAPLPSELGAAVFLFGVLSLAQGEAARVARAVAWGLVLATVYGTIAADPALPGKVGNAISGQKVNPAKVVPGSTATNNKR